MALQDILRQDLGELTPYTPGLRASQVREKSGKSEVLKLSSNEHPGGPFPAALAAISAVSPYLNRYPDCCATALTRRLSERLGVPGERIAVGSGSNELIRVISQAVLRAGDEIVFGWPSFVVYPMMATLFGATAVRVPLKDDAYDLPAMLDAITKKTRIVFLCNPNNPTGTIYRKADFSAFMEAVPEHVLVVADEAYIEFVSDEEFPDALDWFDGKRPLAVMRTFSKMYSLAGLRIGYGIMPEPLAAHVARVREPFNVNMLAQAAAYHSLDDESEVRRRRAENQEQKTYLYSVFDRLGIAYAPSEANFVYFKTERPVEVFEALLAEGVIARDFGTAPALRLTLTGPEDMRKVAQAFDNVVALLGSV